jgi:hypothetical protein
MWSELGEHRALFDRNHGVSSLYVATMPHGAQPNLVLFLMRCADITETIKSFWHSSPEVEMARTLNFC